MEVTKTNFEELLPEIEKTIEDATFLCVDGEFTGLNNENHISAFDTPSQYYNKLLNGALDFLFVQFGLAAFRYDTSTKKYSSKVYNFYIFPRPMNRSAPDFRFLCQSSSLDFLATQGFDFNKLFREGIAYLTKTDEEALKESMAERRRYLQANNTMPPISIPDQFKAQVNSACDKIGELLEPDCKEEEVTVEKCSAFVRKLIYQTVRERYGDNKVEVETKQGVMIARRRVKEVQSPQEREAEAKEKDLKEVDHAVGFSKIIRAIAAAEKLVVGHNMLLDLCHIVQRFCDPLPHKYSDFKDMIHCLFPKIVDTKYMCNNGPLKELIKSSVLENMMQTIEGKPFVKPVIDEPEAYNYKADNIKLHEAGYDAYITGVCFISLLEYLESERGESQGPADKSKALRPYLNKLYLMRTPDTHIDLEGDDPEPSRDHVFFTTFPKKWNSQTIAELFSPYGTVQICWLNDTSAWVALHNRKESTRVMQSLVRGRKTPRDVRVLPFERGSEDLSSPRPNKRQIASPPHTDGHKKRRSSNPKNIETIPEEGELEEKEEEVGGKEVGGDPIAELEKSAETNEGGPAFPVDNAWG